jgi:hypothetical protein
MSERPPGSETLAGRLIDARLHLLDRQVLDRDGEPVTTVDDVELSEIPAGPLSHDQPAPVISALLSGPVLGTRIFGGRPPSSRLERIDWSSLRQLGVALRLRVLRDGLDVGWHERWVAEHVIGRIPGGRHDPE